MYSKSEKPIGSVIGSFPLRYNPQGAFLPCLTLLILPEHCISMTSVILRLYSHFQIA